MFVDILLDREGATKEIIVVEVKCFGDKSAQTYELYVAIGQYLVYRELLIANRIERPLYLAIPAQAFYGIFETIGLAVAINTQMKLIVIDLDKEEVVEWIESFEKKSL